MKKTKQTEEQMIAAVKQMEAGRAVKDLARETGRQRSEAVTTGRSTYSGMDVAEAKRLRALEDENRRLNRDGGGPEPSTESLSRQR